MKVPQRVVWTEGMFMSPQHMQQLDRYHEGFVAARLSAMSLHDWGVVSLELDERALLGGQVKVTRFEGVLPDGQPVAFDGGHPEAPAARPVEGHFPAAQRVLEVFVGMPAEREGGASVAHSTTATTGLRYFSVARSVVDAAGGAADVPVSFAMRNVVVLFGDEPRQDLDAIKVAEIVRDAAGALAIRPEYVPPCRRIGASPWLVSALRQLLALSVAKQRSLAEARRQRDAATVEFSAGDVTRFLLLNAVNTHIPIVNHLIERPEISPEDAYLHLCQYAGALMAFAVDSDPATLPKFTYGDLGGTFGALLAKITELLQKTIKEQHITIPLEVRPDGLRLGRLDDERLARGATFVLTVRSNQPEAAAADQIPRLSKIASWGDIPGMLQSAVPGVPLQVTYRPPSEIATRAGLIYFVLSQASPWWRNVATERTIAIYLPPPYDPASTTLELLAVPQPR
ncbi:MAG TPA: type VI secretion system baseplate subunit TssK [Polyangiaceae bacterium]